MIKYLVACKKGNLLVTPEMRNISETTKIFSVTDLEEVKNGQYDHICEMAEKCHSHISHCEVRVFYKSSLEIDFMTFSSLKLLPFFKFQTCSGKGYLCEICGNNEIIYPFNLTSVGCENCNSYFHRTCFLSKKSNCPKCIRLEKRKNQQESEDEDDEFER